jgi:hypothetical protein
MDPEAAFIVFNSTDTSTGHIQPIILVPYDSVAERNTITMVRKSKTYFVAGASRSCTIKKFNYIIIQPINLKLFMQTVRRDFTNSVTYISNAVNKYKCLHS